MISIIFMSLLFVGGSIAVIVVYAMSTIQDLRKQNKRLWQESEEYRTKYYDLIMQVARKFPNESRHDTAKRYILQAECSRGGQYMD